MCRTTNNNSADNKSLRRIRQSNDAAAADVDANQMPETTQSSINSHSVTFFYAKLNDVEDAERVESKSSEERRKCKRSWRSDRTLRPDARGRINNKECHLFAFGPWLEEELQ